MRIHFDQSHVELRVAEYPPLSELADALVKKEQGDPGPYEEWVKKCEAVKAKYPKKAVADAGK